MNVAFEGNTIKLSRILSVVDTFTIEFVKLLEKAGIDYVIVSGYTALLFGRERITEDIDVIFRREDMVGVEKLYDIISEDYWLLNARTLPQAMALLKENSAIRIAKKDTISPNIELKPAKNELDEYSLSHATEVELNNRHRIRISPLEMQIPYKLYLGTKKDIEDARFLYDLFGEKVDKNKLVYFCRKLGVEEKMRHLGELHG
ncbi:MAG: hypothetical protein AB1657_05990 [Candidatus Micrarchaeota archaeon]